VPRKTDAQRKVGGGSGHARREERSEIDGVDKIRGEERGEEREKVREEKMKEGRRRGEWEKRRQKTRKKEGDNSKPVCEGPCHRWTCARSAWYEPSVNDQSGKGEFEPLEELLLTRIKSSRKSGNELRLKKIGRRCFKDVERQ
jgi:hypothetical protein